MYCCVWFCFHSVLRFWKFIHDVVHISILFLFIAEWDSTAWVYHRLFTDFSTDEHLVCFQLLAIMNKAACEHICTWLCQRMFSFLSSVGVRAKRKQWGQSHMLGAWGSLGPPCGDQNPSGSYMDGWSGVQEEGKDWRWTMGNTKGPNSLKMSTCCCGLNCVPQGAIFKSSPIEVPVTMILFGKMVFAYLIKLLWGQNALGL